MSAEEKLDQIDELIAAYRADERIDSVDKLFDAMSALIDDITALISPSLKP